MNHSTSRDGERGQSCPMSWAKVRALAERDRLADLDAQWKTLHARVRSLLTRDMQRVDAAALTAR